MMCNTRVYTVNLGTTLTNVFVSLGYTLLILYGPEGHRSLAGILIGFHEEYSPLARSLTGPEDCRSLDRSVIGFCGPEDCNGSLVGFCGPEDFLGFTVKQLANCNSYSLYLP